MRRINIIVAIALASAASSGTAWAQAGPGIPTFDVSTYAQTLATVKNTLAAVEQAKAQVAEAQRLYASMNKLTNVNSIATVLNNSAVRNVLPAEARDMTKLMSGDLSSTGAIGQRAEAILSRSNLDTGIGAGGSDADKAYDEALRSSGQKAASNAAVAETAFGVTTARTQGLEQLRTALDSASDAKEVADLQARIAVETAHIQNDQMQLQSVALRQAAQDRLDLASDSARHMRDLRASVGSQ